MDFSSHRDLNSKVTEARKVNSQVEKQIFIRNQIVDLDSSNNWVRTSRLTPTELCLTLHVT